MPEQCSGDIVSHGVCAPLCSLTLDEVAEVVQQGASFGLMPPQCALVCVGTHPTSEAYALATLAAARVAGIPVRLERLPATASQEEVAETLSRVNRDATCHGVMLQLPLPAHLDARALLGVVSDDKDVDCLKESSIRRCLMDSEPMVVPCIAVACEEVLRSRDVLPPPTMGAVDASVSALARKIHARPTADCLARGAVGALVPPRDSPRGHWMPRVESRRRRGRLVGPQGIAESRCATHRQATAWPRRRPVGEERLHPARPWPRRLLRTVVVGAAPPSGGGGDGGSGSRERREDASVEDARQVALGARRPRG
jgi:hypothetical protein